MKELQNGSCLECIALYIKGTLLPGGEARVVETKLSNDVNNPVFDEQLSLPVAEVREQRGHSNYEHLVHFHFDNSVNSSSVQLFLNNLKQ